MASSFTIMRVRGIPIGVHWSWLIIFGIFVWSLTKVLYPAAYPGLDGATYLGMGIATALLFFGSVLLHELSHALLSEREGIHIEGICCRPRLCRDPGLSSPGTPSCRTSAEETTS
jgi:Zn-dependent protease